MLYFLIALEYISALVYVFHRFDQKMIDTWNWSQGGKQRTEYEQSIPEKYLGGFYWTKDRYIFRGRFILAVGTIFATSIVNWIIFALYTLAMKKM